MNELRKIEKRKLSKQSRMKRNEKETGLKMQRKYKKLNENLRKHSFKQ